MIKEFKMVFEVAHMTVHRHREPMANNQAPEKGKPLDSTEDLGKVKL